MYFDNPHNFMRMHSAELVVTSYQRAIVRQTKDFKSSMIRCMDLDGSLVTPLTLQCVMAENSKQWNYIGTVEFEYAA